MTKRFFFTSAGVNDRRFWRSKNDLIYHVAKVESATPFQSKVVTEVTQSEVYAILILTIDINAKSCVKFLFTSANI